MALGVRDLCRQRGLSMLELAERSGLDLQRVRAIFVGRWTPSPEERERIAEVLQTPSAEIAWGHVTPIQHLYEG